MLYFNFFPTTIRFSENTYSIIIYCIQYVDVRGYVYGLYLVDALETVLLLFFIKCSEEFNVARRRKNWLCLVEITEHQMCNLESTTTTVFGSVIIITIIIYPSPLCRA